MRYVIAYDIRNGRRLNAVAKTCCRYGVRVGLSVFEAHFKTREELDAFVRLLSAQTDASKDLIRIYRICENCGRESLILGRSIGENPAMNRHDAFIF